MKIILQDRLVSCGKVHRIGMDSVAPPLQDSVLLSDQSNPSTFKTSNSFIVTTRKGDIISFEQKDGTWVATVNENLPVGFSNKLRLPVYCNPGFTVASLANYSLAKQQKSIHIEKKSNGQQCVYVGESGLLGGGNTQSISYNTDWVIAIDKWTEKILLEDPSSHGDLMQFLFKVMGILPSDLSAQLQCSLVTSFFSGLSISNSERTQLIHKIHDVLSNDTQKLEELMRYAKEMSDRNSFISFSIRSDLSNVSRQLRVFIDEKKEEHKNEYRIYNSAELKESIKNLRKVRDHIDSIMNEKPWRYEDSTDEEYDAEIAESVASTAESYIGRLDWAWSVKKDIINQKGEKKGAFRAKNPDDKDDKGSPKCNLFVHDVLRVHNVSPDVNRANNLPLAKQWYDNNTDRHWMGGWKHVGHGAARRRGDVVASIRHVTIAVDVPARHVVGASDTTINKNGGGEGIFNGDPGVRRYFSKRRK